MQIQSRIGAVIGTLGVCAMLALVLCLTACGAGGTTTGASGDVATDEKATTDATTDATDTTTGKTLRVAMELAYPPFETKDDAGEPSGLSVDFIKDFGAAYGYDVVIENTAWDGLIPSLQTDKADCVISSMTITEEREKAVDFSDPYAIAQLAILANANSGIASVEDLNQEGKTVAVKTGSTGDVYATKNLPNATITRLADEAACVTEVVQGKADGFFYDQLTIYRNQAANPETTKAVYVPFQDPEYWGIAVKEGNAKLLDELNGFIADSKKNGEFDRLTETYLSEEKKAFDTYGFVWFFDFARYE